MTNAKLSRLIREAIEEEGPKQQALAFHNIVNATLDVLAGIEPEYAMQRYFDSPVWPNTGMPDYEQDEMLRVLNGVRAYV